MTGSERLAGRDPKRGPSPVEKWNPPYRGDIGLAIRANGTWEHQGSPILRPALVELFASVLRRDAGGRHYLVTPAEKIDVAVADAPFLAVQMTAGGEGRDQTIIFQTNLGDLARCGPDHPLRFARDPASGGLKPYVLVRGRLEALVTRALYMDLVDLAVPAAHDGGETLEIRSGGATFPLRAA